MRAHDQVHSQARMSAQGCARSNEMQEQVLAVRGGAPLVLLRLQLLDVLRQVTVEMADGLFVVTEGEVGIGA
jgi:hypothetical protein